MRRPPRSTLFPCTTQSRATDIDSDVRQVVARGLTNLAVDQARAEQLDAAISTGERLWETYGTDTDYDIPQAATCGLYDPALHQARAEQLDAAISTGERLWE